MHWDGSWDGPNLSKPLSLLVWDGGTALIPGDTPPAILILNGAGLPPAAALPTPKTRDGPRPSLTQSLLQLESIFLRAFALFLAAGATRTPWAWHLLILLVL